MDGRAVKAILFDLDNTLIETSRAGAIALRKTGEFLKTTLDLDEETACRICDKFKHKLLHESFDPSAGASIDDHRVSHWEESIQETVGGRSTASLAAQCYMLWKRRRMELLRFSPEVRGLLCELRGSYKLLLLTNGVAQTQREKVAVAECGEFFDFIVVAGEHPEQKPSLSIFTRCFGLLGVEARDCVMVGDSLDTDIQGGFNARVRATVWISRTQESDGPVKPDYTIPTVLHLPDVLAQLH